MNKLEVNTSDITLVQNPGAIPRLALINDLTGFGRCSLAVSLPVVSVMGVQACPVPSSLLSNHLGFPTYYFDDYTEKLPNYLNGFSDLNISFDGIACGFLGNVDQIEIIEDFLNQSAAAKGKLFILDPVMGDHGHTYSTITPAHCNKMKHLAAYADILIPNITEACLLTDIPYQPEGFTGSKLEEICNKLDPKREKNIVITGIYHQGVFQNYVWEHGSGDIYECPTAGASRPGTGDLFAAILSADALNHVSFSDSVKKAADFVALCIKDTEKANVPLQEGVLFEKNLAKLI